MQFLYHKNPEPRSPKPLRTIKEPSEKNSNARDPILETLCAVHGVTDEAAKSFIRHCKILKKPLSPIAANRLAKMLWEIVQANGDASDALGMAEEKGWQSIQPDWYFNAKGKSHANRNQITISNGCVKCPAQEYGIGKRVSVVILAQLSDHHWWMNPKEAG